MRKDFRIRNAVKRAAWPEKDEASRDQGIEGEAATEVDVEAAGTTGGRHQGKTRGIH